jgi:hypothetical protein
MFDSVMLGVMRCYEIVCFFNLIYKNYYHQFFFIDIKSFIAGLPKKVITI